MTPAGHGLASLPRGKKAALGFLRVLVAASLLGFMVWRVSPAKLLSAWRDVEPFPPVVAFLLLLAGQILSGYKWGLILRSYQPNVGPLWAIRTYFTGMFFNTVLPWLYGGDGVRSYLASKQMGLSLRAAIGSVLIDRLTGYAALLTLGLLGLSASYLPLPITIFTGLVMAGCLVAVVSLVPGWCRSIAARLHPLSPFLGEETLGVILRQALPLSFVFHFAVIGALGLIMWGGDLHLDWGYVAVAVLGSATASVVPISLGGLGAHEMSLTALLAAGGAPWEGAAAAALMFGLMFTSLGLLGGLVMTLGGIALVRGSLAKRAVREAL